MHVDTAQDIVNTLLEDIDADLPSHKSEVRILPTGDPRRFDVTLLTGFDPIYVGTVSCQGNVWKPVEVMPGVGRQFRSKLHFVGPNKEDVAMAMVQTLRPIWKAKITPHLTQQLESDAVDPKSFVTSRADRWNWVPYYPKPSPYNDLSHEMVLRDGRVIVTNQIQVGDYIRFKNERGNDFNIRLERMANPAHAHLYIQMAHRQEPQPATWSVWATLPGRGNSRKITEFEAQTIDEAFEKATHAVERIYLRLGESSKAEIEKEASNAEKPASPEQAEAGNYRKGHVNIQGLEISIENACGSTRSGVGKDGKSWSVKMPAHYGYITRVTR